MAIIYYGLGGNDATGDGSLGNPYLNYDTAITNSSAGDTVALVDGILQHPTGHYIFDDNRIVGGASFRGGVLTPAASETTRCARTSGNLSAANNPWRCENIVIDGLGQVTQSLEIVQDAAEDLILQLHNIEVRPGNTYNVFLGHRRGRIEIVNLKLTGGGDVKAFVSTASLAGDGNQVIDISGLDLDLDYDTDTFAIQLTKINNLTNTFDVALKGLRGTVNVQNGVNCTVLDINGCAAPVVSGFNLTITGDSSGSVTGILCRGQSIAIANDVLISAGKLNFYASSGYGIALGQSTTDSNVTAGKITGVTIQGKYYAANTPHNAVIGQGVTGSAEGLISLDGYVGLLLSKCTLGSMSGCTAIDCYGPSIYIKGATNASVKNNTFVLSGKYQQRTNGVISVTDQGGVNTAAATIQENTIIVSDISKIHSLAQVTSSQTCSFTRNTYIIPDSIDLSTELLFSNNQPIGDNYPANQTYAQWLANGFVTDDVIIQMPVAEINELISKAKSLASSAAIGFLFSEIAPGVNVSIA